MRQPTNLRGATLPGLSQPSEKEGPRHRSFWLPRLQRQAGSLLLWLWGGGAFINVWGNKARLPALPSPFTFQRRSRKKLPSQEFLWVGLPGWLCWYSGVTDSVWELVATETEAWHLNCTGNITARCRAGNINHSKLGTDGSWIWQEVTELRVKFHRFTINSCHAVLSRLVLAKNDCIDK